MVKWEQGHTWQEIADSYLSYVQYLGRYSQKITVVFDGYSSSPKDHDHTRRTKNSCCDVQIRPNMMHLTPRAKFLDNTHNKSEIIHLLSSAFQKHQITVELYDNDADTSIVKAALAAAKDDSIEVSELCGWLLCCYSISYYFQVRAEDADVLIMLIHHSSYTNHPLFFTSSKGSYDDRRIQETLSERQRLYLLFCHTFTGCDTVFAIASHGKTALFDRFCAGDIDEHMDTFLDVQASKDVVIRSGISIFQHICHAPGTAFAAIRYSMFSRKAVAGLIKPETLPPMEGWCSCTAFSLCLSTTQDWMLLQSMSLDPSGYGRTLGSKWTPVAMSQFQHQCAK